MADVLKKPDQTALLVIDIVNSCCHEKCEEPDDGITYNKIREMVDGRLLNFIDRYRKEINQNVIVMGLKPWTREYLPQKTYCFRVDPPEDGGF